MSEPRTLTAEEFEYLALMGRTQAGDLIVGKGGAERVLQRAKQLALSPDDVLDLYVPGRLRCPKCGFELTKATLFVKTGQVGASKAEVYQETEPCPNDGTLMDRVTWRQEADANREYATRLIDELLQATGMPSLPAAMEFIKAKKREPEQVAPGTTLASSFERYVEEELGERPAIAPTDDFELLKHTARRAFYAGAQTLCAVMASALSDEIDEETSAAQLDDMYAELAQALEEMKL